ncbi:MAG: hypothetical protein EBX40_00175 [Gammaproteobacteria bacterium]|nr:hypothetical protein [Gammaproteobacteria bacterium]
MPVTPVNPYPTIVTDLNQEAADILAAFTNAEASLTSSIAPYTQFLELEWTTTRINRIWDGSQVSSLSFAEQYRLYQQLGGLFNLAMRNLLYP